MKQFLIDLTVWSPYPIVSFVFSVCLTWVCIRILPKFGLIDIPRGRHQHAKPVPRGGGIAIIISFFIGFGMMAVMCLGSDKYDTPAIRASLHNMVNFLIPAAVIAVTGLLDDRYELRSYVKLAVQLAVGVFFFWCGCGIDSFIGYELPAYIGLPLTVCWVVGIINAFNLIDGLDGVAAGLAGIASFSLAVWMGLCGGSMVSIMLMLTFCSACLGFLRYNFAPAKIFMGDTGSMFLGLFFAYVSMAEYSKAATITSLLVPMMAIGLPLFDVFLAIWRRFFRRYIQHDKSVSIMDGDHDHLHHRIMKEQGDQRKTACIMYALALLLSLCAQVSVFLESNLPALIFTIFFIALFTIIRYANIEVFDTITCVANGMRFPHKNFIFTALHPVIDAVFIGVAFVVTMLITPDVLKRPFSLINILVFVCPFIFCLCVSGVYRTFWLRSGINRYYKLFKALFIAGVIGFSVLYLIYASRYQIEEAQLKRLIGMYLLFFLFTLFLIGGERFLLRYYESFGYGSLYIRNRNADTAENRVVIYGGGLWCRLFLASLFCDSKSWTRIPEVIGIIDDDLALHHLNVYGFNVLGSFSDIEKIYQKRSFGEIVVTVKEMEPEVRKKLQDFAEKHHITVKIFSYSMETLEER